MAAVPEGLLKRLAQMRSHVQSEGDAYYNGRYPPTDQDGCDTTRELLELMHADDSGLDMSRIALQLDLDPMMGGVRLRTRHRGGDDSFDIEAHVRGQHIALRFGRRVLLGTIDDWYQIRRNLFSLAVRNRLVWPARAIAKETLSTPNGGGPTTYQVAVWQMADRRTIAVVTGLEHRPPDPAGHGEPPSKVTKETAAAIHERWPGATIIERWPAEAERVGKPGDGGRYAWSSPGWRPTPVHLADLANRGLDLRDPDRP